MDKEVIDSEEKDLIYEYDSNVERWEYYKRIYPFVSDIKELHIDGNRYVGCFTFKTKNNQVILEQVTNSSRENYIELSGDCFFNFNDKKVGRFMQIKGIDDSTKKRLVIFKNNFHYSNENCVLLPKTGAINNFKGNVYYKLKEKSFRVYNQVGRPPKNRDDRPDTLIYYLSKFWTAKKDGWELKEAALFLKNSIFLPSLSGDNFELLYDFLNEFKELEDFCTLFFGMNEELTNCMKKNGSVPILDADSLNRYMDLAEKYWKCRNVN